MPDFTFLKWTATLLARYSKKCERKRRKGFKTEDDREDNRKQRGDQGSNIMSTDAPQFIGRRKL